MNRKYTYVTIAIIVSRLCGIYHNSYLTAVVNTLNTHLITTM